MSQYIEDSPISDTKMDISEATSQESPGNSPDTDDQHPATTQRINRNSTQHTRSTAEVLIESTNTNGKDGHLRLTTDDLMSKLQEFPVLLDNRKSGLNKEAASTTMNKSCAINKSVSSLSTRCALTLTNSHPLMSPKSTNSDAENSCSSSPRKVFNYPDVIPSSEPLRLANPCSSLNTTLDILSNNYRSTQQPSHVDDATNSDYQNSEEEEESGPDVSQYQANVTPLYQSVALVSLTTDKPCIRSTNLPSKFLTKSTSKHLIDDQSSNETMSNRSFDNDFDDYDDDLEQNLVSASVSSSMLNDDVDFQANSGGDGDVCVVGSVLTNDLLANDDAAACSGRNNKQKIVLSDGKARDIDMKVIEPYKRVLSHGGYLSSGGQNAIVVFSACHLPDRSRADYHYVMDNLFFYVVKTLEQLVTEDYVLVYLHGGSTRSNVPPFPWLKKCYQLLDRRLRKRLKNLFMVHPTFWLKSIVWMARPFISSKFWRKLIYVRTLDELYRLVPLERAAVPDKVKKYDVKYT